MTIFIDDLLQHEEEPPAAPARRRAGAGWWLRTLVVTAALTAVVIAGLRTVGLAVSVYAAVAAVLTLLLVRRVTAAVAPPLPLPVHRGPTGEEDGSYHWGGRDALREAVNRWKHPLDWSAADVDRWNSRLLPRLGALADERLRQRHGFTRDSDPTRARAVLGEPLWSVLATPVRRPPSPRDLAAVVAHLEKI